MPGLQLITNSADARRPWSPRWSFYRPIHCGLRFFPLSTISSSPQLYQAMIVIGVHKKQANLCRGDLSAEEAHVDDASRDPEALIRGLLRKLFPSDPFNPSACNLSISWSVPFATAKAITQSHLYAQLHSLPVLCILFEIINNRQVPPHHNTL